MSLFINSIIKPLFQLYRGSQCTYPCFPGVIFAIAPHNIFSKPLAVFSHSIVETMENGEIGINPAAMTITNAGEEYLPSRGSNKRPPILKSCTLRTELYGLAV